MDHMQSKKGKKDAVPTEEMLGLPSFTSRIEAEGGELPEQLWRAGGRNTRYQLKRKSSTRSASPYARSHPVGACRGMLQSCFHTQSREPANLPQKKGSPGAKMPFGLSEECVSVAAGMQDGDEAMLGKKAPLTRLFVQTMANIAALQHKVLPVSLAVSCAECAIQAIRSERRHFSTLK
jgi:hypothetical protein